MRFFELGLGREWYYELPAGLRSTTIVTARADARRSTSATIVVLRSPIVTARADARRSTSATIVVLRSPTVTARADARRSTSATIMVLRSPIVTARADARRSTSATIVVLRSPIVTARADARRSTSATIVVLRSPIVTARADYYKSSNLSNDSGTTNRFAEFVVPLPSKPQALLPAGVAGAALVHRVGVGLGGVALVVAFLLVVNQHAVAVVFQD